MSNIPDIPNMPAITYSVDIIASPVDGDTVSGNGQYEAGTTATVTAVRNEGFRFAAWTEGDTQIPQNRACHFP